MSRKSDCRLEVGEDAGQTIAPATINVTQFAAELPHCLAALRLGLGRGEIGDCLGLQQIEFAVEEGTAGGIPRGGRPPPPPGPPPPDGHERRPAPAPPGLDPPPPPPRPPARGTPNH